MNYSKLTWRKRFQKHYTELPVLGLTVDLSRIDVDDAFFAAMEPQIHQVFAAMPELEKRAIANPDENLMFEHYRLRNPALAPTPAIPEQTDPTVHKIVHFSAQVHVGKIRGGGGDFKNCLLIDIAGSAPGPQFVAHALRDRRIDKLKPFFFHNADPNALDRVSATFRAVLNRTLSTITSKSGATTEKRSEMLIAKASFQKTGFAFGRHVTAFTTQRSDPEESATKHKRLATLLMWDWLTDRNGELSTVALLSASLQQFDADALLAGVTACNEFSRKYNVKLNPEFESLAGLYESANVTVGKNLVVLRYKGRLVAFIKFIQRLLMASLGKLSDFTKRAVRQDNSILAYNGLTY